MEPWTGAERAFAVKAFYKNGDSFVIAQHEFLIEFRIHRKRTIPSAHAIKTQVRNFEATGSTLKKKGSSVKTVRTPENIAVVRETILKPAFDRFYAKIFTSTPTKCKLLMRYLNITM